MSRRRASRTLGRDFGAAQEKACPDSNPVVCWFSASFRLRMLGGKIPVADAVVASLLSSGNELSFEVDMAYAYGETRAGVTL